MSVVVLRTAVLYAAIVIALRIMGKRQLGELQPSELVVTLLVSNIATLSIEDTNVPLLGSLLPIFTLVSCEVIMSVVILKSNRMRKLISGNPIIIIRDGKLDQKVMRDLRWTLDDLNEQLRINGTFDLNEVGMAIVETSGSLSVYPKFFARPVTAEMLSLPGEGELDVPPITVISDGQLIADALRFCNLRQEWLDGVLRDHKLTLKDVFLMTCDRKANYTLIPKEGHQK